MAKKALLMLCMLAVITAQLYSNAFAMPMGDGSPLSVHKNTSHEILATDYLNLDAVAENYCDQLKAESSAHCFAMQASSNSCGDMTDCAQHQCVNPVDCRLSNYLFDVKASVTAQYAINELLLAKKSSPLYCPPISR